MNQNIEYIYSKRVPRGHPQSLLHLVIRKDYFNDISNRQDVISSGNFLQLALLNLKQNQTFRPHKHIYNTFYTETKISQESWVVMQGSVEATYYDLDDKILEKRIINAGDLSITLVGGHNYTSLSDDTRVLEFKTGPYLGQEKDKVFI